MSTMSKAHKLLTLPDAFVHYVNDEDMVVIARSGTYWDDRSATWFQKWSTVIMADDKPIYYSDDELHTPTSATNESAMATTLAFLYAGGESYLYEMRYGHSDNSDLYPHNVREWAYQNMDEIQMGQLDFEEGV